MTKPKVTATTEYGTLTRSTWRKYTHVVALITSTGIRGLSWCGSVKLAETQLRYWTANSGQHLRWRYPIDGLTWEVRIVPVDGPLMYACGHCANDIENGGITDDEGRLKLTGVTGNFYALCALCGAPATHEVAHEARG